MFTGLAESLLISRESIPDSKRPRFSSDWFPNTGQEVGTLLVTNGCVKSLVRGSHVDTESGGRIGHIEDGESVAGSVGGLWAG